jgi:3-phenylpropionate/trans-cinnamate dioxygenase ferredoxin subunit
VDYFLCNVADIPADAGLRVSIPGRKPVSVFRVGTEVFVVDDLCTHQGASLAKYGEVKDFAVECTWHCCVFDLRDGRVLDGPCERPLRSHPCAMKDGKVYVGML